MLDWLLYLSLLAIFICGLLLNLFTLPGNWLMLTALLAYAWWTGWSYVSWGWLVALVVIALLAEAVEFLAAGKGAKSAGGTLWGTIGAIVGALIGGLFLTGLVPIPIVGTVAGIILGTFLGAMGAELLGGKEVHHSFAIGTGAAKGRLYGTILKFAFGCLIFALAAFAALPLGGRAATMPLPATAATPTTAPTSNPAAIP